MPLFGKKVKVIHHIDHLHMNMKMAIKTILDSYLPDIIRGYGLKYADPKWGEPIFIPYGYLDGEYRDPMEAFSKILEELNERKNDGLPKFKEWYPNNQFYDVYRFVQYSVPGTEEGYTPGIAADPLMSYNYFKEGLEEVKAELQGKVIVANPLLSSITNFTFLDPIIPKRNEIIDAYVWFNKYFHEEYDKDKMYDEKLGRHYMNLIFDFLESFGKDRRASKIDDGDVLLIPSIIWPKNKVFDCNNSIQECWRNSYLFKSSMFHEIEALPVILNNVLTDNIVNNYANRFKKIIIIGNKKMPQLDRCEDCPKSLKSLKIVKENQYSKVFMP